MRCQEEQAQEPGAEGKKQSAKHKSFVSSTDQRASTSANNEATYKQIPVLQPGMKENYKSHLDFNAVKKYSELDATEYNTTRPLKPNERAELIEKIVKSRGRYPGERKPFNKTP